MPAEKKHPLHGTPHRPLTERQKRYIKKALHLAHFTDYPTIAERAQLKGKRNAKTVRVHRLNKREKIRDPALAVTIGIQRFTRRQLYEIAYLLEHTNLGYAQISTRVGVYHSQLRQILKNSGHFFPYVQGLQNYKDFKKQVRKNYEQLKQQNISLTPAKHSKIRDTDSLRHLRALEDTRMERWRQMKQTFNNLLKRVENSNLSKKEAQTALRRLKHLSTLTRLEIPEATLKRLQDAAGPADAKS